MTTRFSDSKLLTIGMEAFVGTRGNSLDDFEVVGVHHEGSFKDFLIKCPRKQKLLLIILL